MRIAAGPRIMMKMAGKMKIRVGKSISTTICPKSYIRAESLGWLEAFAVWSRLGGRSVEEMSARQGEAFLVIESELAAESRG